MDVEIGKPNLTGERADLMHSGTMSRTPSSEKQLKSEPAQATEAQTFHFHDGQSVVRTTQAHKQCEPSTDIKSKLEGSQVPEATRPTFAMSFPRLGCGDPSQYEHDDQVEPNPCEDLSQGLSDFPDHDACSQDPYEVRSEASADQEVSIRLQLCIHQAQGHVDPYEPRQGPQQSLPSLVAPLEVIAPHVWSTAYDTDVGQSAQASALWPQAILQWGSARFCCQTPLSWVS